MSGNWSLWSYWSYCTQPCGGGIQSRNRTCDNPPPAFGGQFCPNDSDEEQDCNTNSCPEFFDGNLIALNHFNHIPNNIFIFILDYCFLNCFHWSDCL